MQVFVGKYEHPSHAEVEPTNNGEHGLHKGEQIFVDSGLWVW